MDGNLRSPPSEAIRHGNVHPSKVQVLVKGTRTGAPLRLLSPRRDGRCWEAKAERKSSRSHSVAERLDLALNPAHQPSPPEERTVPSVTLSSPLTSGRDDLLDQYVAIQGSCPHEGVTLSVLQIPLSDLTNHRRHAYTLTVSDTAACPGQADLDKTGPDISASLLGISPRLFSNIRTEIAPDDVASIRSMVRSWADDDDGVDVIICTGGTGWGERDVTVEALTPLLDKQLPSLSQALTAYGLSKTPFAALSNPLCGLISSKKRTLVVALPGSKGGVKDGMNVLIPLLQHMLSLLGNSSSAKQAVEELHGPRTAEPIVSCTDDGPAISSQVVTADTTAHDLTQHSHQHHHHHHHHHRQGHVHPQPNQPVSSRQRRSPHVLTPLADAVEIINRVIGSSGLGTEKRHLNPKIAGHVLAESISAPHPLPLWHSTNVDGYAFHSEDGPGDYPVRPKDSARPLERGQIERVTTGGPVPTGADCIVMVEDTELISASPSGEELFVRVLAPAAKKGENLRLPGSDLQEGEVIMQANELIGLSGGEIGLIGSVGRKEVLVHRKPRVALLSTGSELVNLSSPDSGSAAAPTASDTEPPPLPPRPSRATIEPLSSGPPAAARPAGGWTGIYDSNRPALQAVIESMGWEVIDLGIVKDETGAHEAAMRRGLEVADVVITTGGTSMGEGDLVKPLLEHSFGATIHFGRVAMAPGKPTTFATVPASDGGRDKVFFALPGNPASALVTFFVFVVPALRGLGGWAEKSRGLRPVWVEMTHTLPLGGRPTYHRCTLEFSHSGLPLATSTGGQRSSRVGSLKGAEILVLVPASNAGEESRHVEKGARLEGLLLPGGWSG